MILDADTRARLVGVFVSEVEETVASLGGLVPALARDGGALRDFGRMAHGLKGAAASLGFEDLARALHGLEELALAIPGAESATAAVRVEKVALALEFLSEGSARMAASRAGSFPEDVVERLLRCVGAGEEAEDGGEERAADGSGEGAGRAPQLAPAGAPERRPGADGRTTEAAERISVPATEVDAALRLASSLARGAAQLHEALGRGAGDLAGAAQSLAAAAAGLEGIVASLRLLPADSALSGLEEEVAELARQLGKRVALLVAGRDVRADRRTLQAARGMIRHLVRNALDHGLEPGPERVRAGKAEEGRLSISLEAGESALRVAVSDDGAGFDAAAIRAELARRGEDAARLASLSDEEVLERWAVEGGSTRATATQVSGRGLGLSAVAQLARAAGGGLRIRSARGEGSTVEFTLPLEVYAVEALTVLAAGRWFGVPLAAVERTVHVAAAGDAIHEGPTGRTVAVGETILPLVTLADALGLPHAGAGERFCVVVRSEGAMAAFTVEEVGAVEGMVPASVPGVAQADALVTGVVRLGDGTAVSVLNPRLAVARARAALAAPSRVRAPALDPPRRAAGARRLEVVLAEDSLATREVLRVLLEERGFRVRVAADGEEALERVREQVPDVVVSDVNMPRRDGLSLTRALRASAETERLPIVLLTSQDDDDARAAGAAAGADAYLVKSRFNARVLEDALSRIGVATGAA